MEKSSKILESKKVQLGYRERDKLYQKEYSKLKVKIALNCFELFALFTVLTIGFYLIFNLFKWSDTFLHASASIIISLIFTIIFYKIKKYQINISRFDKEDIYKKISKDLLNEKS